MFELVSPGAHLWSLDVDGWHIPDLSFISKIIEKAIATQIHSHLINNDIVDNFQSAYKTGHSCETALLRVYNDIVTTIGRGNGAMLVLLDLSAAFDTIRSFGVRKRK